DIGVVAELRCNAPITWETMEWSHNAHGARKSDSLEDGIASCKDCHRRRHASQGVPRRPGKIMKIIDARAYWENTHCFCEKESKKPRESFGPECRAKLSKQILYDLENSDDPDTYRQTLALAELEIISHV